MPALWAGISFSASIAIGAEDVGTALDSPGPAPATAEPVRSHPARITSPKPGPRAPTPGRLQAPIDRHQSPGASRGAALESAALAHPGRSWPRPKPPPRPCMPASPGRARTGAPAPCRAVAARIRRLHRAMPLARYRPSSHHPSGTVHRCIAGSRIGCAPGRPARRRPALFDSLHIFTARPINMTRFVTSATRALTQSVTLADLERPRCVTALAV